MFILSIIVGIYLIITILALITSIARFLATSTAERDLKKKMLKAVLEQTIKQNGQFETDNSLIKKFMNLKIDGIIEENPYKIFVFNVIMHFIPIFHGMVLLSNLNDVVLTFRR